MHSAPKIIYWRKRARLPTDKAHIQKSAQFFRLVLSFGCGIYNCTLNAKFSDIHHMLPILCRPVIMHFELLLFAVASNISFEICRFYELYMRNVQASKY